MLVLDPDLAIDKGCKEVTLVKDGSRQDVLGTRFELLAPIVDRFIAERRCGGGAEREGREKVDGGAGPGGGVRLLRERGGGNGRGSRAAHGRGGGEERGRVAIRWLEGLERWRDTIKEEQGGDGASYWLLAKDRSS